MLLVPEWAHLHSNLHRAVTFHVARHVSDLSPLLDGIDPQHPHIGPSKLLGERQGLGSGSGLGKIMLGLRLG